MQLEEVLDTLEKMGNEQTRKIWASHGAKAPFFGVKIGDMKTIQKKIKRDQALALELYKTGNADAMYFAGLICDPQLFTKKQLQEWADKASWYMLREYTVAWAASESKYGRELALEWINADEPHLQSIGWSTYSCLLALTKDEELDIAEIEELMERIVLGIHQEANRTRYTMNGFLIAVGTYVAALSDKAKTLGAKIGKVQVELGNTACKVPDIVTYIEKVAKAGKQGNKRKTVFC